MQIKDKETGDIIGIGYASKGGTYTTQFGTSTIPIGYTVTRSFNGKRKPMQYLHTGVVTREEAFRLMIQEAHITIHP